MNTILTAVITLDGAFVRVFQASMRYLAPVLAAFILWRCIKPLLTFRREPEIWAWLCFGDQKRRPILHWESVIGSSKRSDIVIDSPEVSKSHAVLTRYDDGSWTITDTESKTGVFVNGNRVDIAAISADDVITIGGTEMTLSPITRKQEIKLAKMRTKGSHPFASMFTLILLSAFQALVCLSYVMVADSSHIGSILAGFGGIVAAQWALMLFYLFIRKASFEVETIAFFLCTMGMAAICAVRPSEAVKQLIAMVMGLGVYLGIGWSVRDLERAKKFRNVAAVAGIALLIITLLFGREYYGAKNWLVIGGLSLQPSELSKVCFVYMGASAMDRIINKRNLILFIGYAIAICGCLAIMNDFGGALIFFVAFLLIAYMRSGSIGTLALACTSLGFAGVIALRFAPHAMRRFTTWRHVWENPTSTGYQQTRSLICIASGGLLGMGAGKGWMKNVFAADSDVVFATLCEEWGLILCLMLIICIIALALFAIRSAAVERSSFYVIGACTAAGILLMQAILNAFGTVDVLPFTGVTFPFVSNGGSGMMGAWGLLAFVKAADTRQNASFAVRQSKEGLPDNE